MRFVLEESSWVWDGEEREGFIERIERLLDRTDVAFEREERFAASHELLQQRVFGHELSELLFNPELPLALPPEVSQRVVALFQALTFWDDFEEWPELEISVGKESYLSVSGAFAHTRCARGEPTACLPLPGGLKGPTEVVVAGRALELHFVVDEATHRAFFREVLALESADEKAVETLARHAYPDLFFYEGVWRGLGHLEGGYLRVRESLHRLLGVLDDHGAWIYSDESGRLSREEPLPEASGREPVTNQLVERRFKRWGFEVAPEKPNVRADGTCRRARERELNGRTLYCEWHFKFEPHINRLHLHPPVPESQGKLVVAILRDHLPLPGNG